MDLYIIIAGLIFVGLVNYWQKPRNLDPLKFPTIILNFVFKVVPEAYYYYNTKTNLTHYWLPEFQVHYYGMYNKVMYLI